MKKVLKNALQIFREGKDYIQVAREMNLEVSEIERHIHRLRSLEKGDTSQEDYLEQKQTSDRRFQDKHRAYQREWQREQRSKASAGA